MQNTLLPIKIKNLYYSLDKKKNYENKEKNKDIKFQIQSFKKQVLIQNFNSF